MRRLGRWIVRLGVAVVLVAAAAVGGGIVYLRSPSGGARVLAEIEAAVTSAGGRFTAERIRVTSLRRVELSGVRLSFGRQSRLRADRATVVWMPLALVWGEVRIRRLTLETPRVRLEEGDGNWGFPADEEDDDAFTIGPRIRLSRIEIERGRVAIAWGEPRDPTRLVLRDVEGSAGVTIGRTTEVDVRTLRLRVAGARVGALALRGAVVVSERDTRVDAQLATGESTLALGAALGRDGTIRIDATSPRLTRADLRRLAPSLELPADVAASIEMRGPRSALATTIDVAVGPTIGLRAEGTLNAMAWPPHGELALAGSHVVLDAVGRIDAETLRLQRDEGDDGVAARGVLAVAKGRVAIDGRIERTRAGGIALQTAFEIDDLSPFVGLPASVRGTAGLSGGVVTTRMTATDRDDRVATIEARIGDLGPAWHADVSLDVADPALGVLATTARVRAAAPGVVADVRTLSVASTQATAPWRLSAPGSLRWDGVSATTEGLTLVRGAGRIRIQGGVSPARGDDALAVDLRADGIDVADLRDWIPSGIESIEGRVEATAEVRGAFASPRIDGAGSLDATRVDVTGIGRFDVLRVHVQARSGDAVVIDSLEAHKGKGTITGAGRIGFAPGGDAPIEAELKLRRMVIARRPLYRAVVGGRVTVSGTVEAPRIDAALRIPEGVIRPRLLPDERAADRDPTITVVGEDAPAPEPAAAERLAPVAIHASVALGDEVFLRRKDADIRLAGTLVMDKTVAGPFLLTGAIELAEGWYAFRERRFDVREGTIRFTGTPRPDPELKIRARHRAPGYIVWVDVGGVASAPTLQLSSDPSLSEADVLAVLLFGRPASELKANEQDQVGREAQSVALSYAAPALAASARRILPVDRVEVRGDELMVARSVTQDVFISLAQELTAGGGQIVGIEYDVTPRTSLKLSTSTRGSSAIDFFWRRRY